MTQRLPSSSIPSWLTVCRSASLAVLLALVFAVPAVADTESATIRSGHSGHWYDPARDGEGFALEILENDGALLYWFTYDEEGRQRWLIATGNTEQSESGEYLDFPSLIVTRGGRFGPDFNPADVVREEVGSATLWFKDCDAGEFAFEAFGQTMSFPVERLAHTMGMPCESRNGVAGRESTELAGQSGSWFDMNHDGEGYSLQWISPERALLTWYSYDAEGQQYWMIGVGELDELGQLQFPDLTATRGAQFGAAFNPEDVERFDWGTLSLALGCNDGEAQYASALAPFGNGDFNLQRLTQPRGLACPYQRPSLSDLYQITYEPIPLFARPIGLSNDGALYAEFRTVVDPVTDEARHEIARREPWGSAWDILPNTEFEFSFPVYVSSDGNRLARHRMESSAEGTWLRLDVRDGEQDWTPLDSSPDGRFQARVAAPNLVAFAGGGGTPFFPIPGAPVPVPWRWTAETGLQLLPVPADTNFYQPRPVLMSRDDGHIVVGLIQVRDEQDVNNTRALRWVDGGEPESLHDRDGANLMFAGACSENCELIFGDSSQTFSDSGDTLNRQAWFWRGPADTGYLGELELDLDDSYTGGRYSINSATLDGSLAVGSHVSGFRRVNPPHVNREGLLWTQRTGLVSLNALIQGLGIDQIEVWTSRSAVSITDDGSAILLTGEQFFPEHQGVAQRTAVLYLQPRSEDW